MRRFAKLWVWIFFAAGVSAQVDTVLLEDNFNDNSMDLSKWSTDITATGHTSFDESSAGGIANEESGYLWIRDAAGAYKTMLLPVDGKGEIVVTRNTYVTRGSGNLVSRPDEIVAEDGTVLLRWGYHYYIDGDISRDGFGGFDDPLVDPAWDTAWVAEVITYDPITGAGTYSYGGDEVSISGVALSAGTTNLYLRGSAYAVGSSTDWKVFDDFKVTQTDRKLLTVGSAYGSPVPGIGTNAYETGSTVTCSVANVTVDGVTYECTGWIGTGSVPASGTTNEVVFTLSEDSSITWNWELLLEDDFDDEVLDTSKWTFISYSGSGGYNTNLVGSSISESNEFMNISQDSSVGGAYQSCRLSVNDRELIVIERRTKVGHTYSSAIMSDHLVSESGTTLLQWNYYYYYSYPSGIYGFGGTQGPWVTGVWGTWFDETIIYNPLSGQGSYSLNGGTPVPITGVPLAAGTQVYLRGSAYGADGAAGYTKQFDTFKVSQVQDAQRASLRVSSAYGSPTPGSMPYDLGTVVTCSVDNIVVQDGLRYQCAGWSGSGSVPVSGTTNQVVVTLTEDSSITWSWQVLDASLTVYSSYGSPVPARGTHIYEFGSAVTCSVDNVVVEGGTRYQCTGSFLSGSSAGNGTTNEVVAVMNENRSLTWKWAAESHWMEIAVEGSGSVNLSSDFYPAGSIQTLVATPDEGWRFEGWRDGYSGPGDAVVSINRPKTITAVFFSPVTITNASVSQVEGTRTVNVAYDLWAEGSALVNLEVYRNGTNLSASSFSGAVGMVAPGTNRLVSWNAGADWNLNVDELTFRLSSEDGLPFYAPYSLNAPSLVPQTGQTNDYSLAGSDGDLQSGLEWPEPRFTDNGDGTVSDNLTGLMWVKGQYSSTWGGALQYCASMTTGGHNDWRVPNVREMRTLFSSFNYYQPVLEPDVFSLSGDTSFWTSTLLNPNTAYVVHSRTGELFPTAIGYSISYYPYTSYYTYRYMPVRGTATGPACVAKTGQTASYTGYTTEDGDLQLGQAWPEPRFTDHGDGTATDNLTGLMWTTNAAIQDTWANALNICNEMTVGGYDDWHLPTVLELESLVDFGKQLPAPKLPAGHPFVGVVVSSSAYNYHYWTGTTCSGLTGYGYQVSFYDGRTHIYQKTAPARVLACRGGIAVQSEAPPEPRAWVPLPETGQTNSYAANDDGALQTGISPPSPRFSYYNEFMFRDNLTGLLWYIHMSDSAGALLSWDAAMGYAEYTFSETGYLWRMPNVREMLSLMDLGQTAPALPESHPFDRVQTNGMYWTSTSQYGGLGSSSAWQVNMANGTTYPAAKGTASGFCALVYGPVGGTYPVYLQVTGQTNSYYSRDDGDIQFGVPEAWVRFADNENGTVSDTTTGLMWLKSPDACGMMTWAEAVQYCADLSYGGYSDWRLPNIRELESLVDYSQGGSETVLPAGHLFDEIDMSGNGHYFWSSTTLNSDGGKALALTLYQGNSMSGSKQASIKVWPVRGRE